MSPIPRLQNQDNGIVDVINNNSNFMQQPPRKRIKIDPHGILYFYFDYVCFNIYLFIYLYDFPQQNL